jgi:outer membrane protein assembly factor BamB
MGWDGEQDTVYCLDAATGQVKWKKSYPCKRIFQWPGPRCTPTIEGAALYTLGQHGQLYAWNAATGDQIWSRQLPAAYNPDVDYGFAWSPLISGKLVILATGSRGLAIDKHSGKIAWGDDERAGACASAAPITHEGKPAFAMLAMDGSRDFCTIVGVEAATGRELFRSSPWKEKWGAACSDLVIDGRQIFITTAQEHRKSARFTFAGAALKQDWSSNKLTSYTGNCILMDGHLYGVNTLGQLLCLDWKTGQVKWSQRGFGNHGNLIAADGKLFVQCSKSGELVVVDASPAAYKERRRFRVFSNSPDTFTAPTLSDGRLFCRSYAGQVVALEVR